MPLIATPPTSLCIVRLSAIGDTCHALAVVRRLQDNWPDTKLSWIIGSLEASLMDGIDGVEFITFDKKAGGRGVRDVARQLAGRRFDAVLCMHASMRANRLYRLIDAPVKLGFDRARARDFQWLFTNRRIPARPREHAMQAMLGFADAIGAAATPLRWDIPLSEEDRAFATGRRQNGKPLVAISPCSSNRARNFRNWPVDRFVELGRRLRERHGAGIVVTGGPTPLELDYGRAISEATGAENLVGRTSLKQLLAVIAEADVLVCPDSGPAHMATTVATPVVGLYATSNPDRTGPYLSLASCVNRYPQALQAFSRRTVDEVRWGQRVRDPRAMELIEVDDVSDRVASIIGDVPPA